MSGPTTPVPADGRATPSPAPATPRLPRWVVVAFGAGTGGWIIVERIVFTWLYFFWIRDALEGGQGYVAPLVFSIIVFAGRLVDAVTDPLVARWSDNHGGSRGRRRPFLLWAGLPYVLVGAALFFPPVAGPSTANAVYLGVGLGVFYVLFTLYVSPYLALLADLSPRRDDRVDLATSKAVFQLLGSSVALIASGLLIAAFGFPTMLVVLGAVALVLLYAPTLIDETRFSDPKPATLALLPAVRTTLQNRPFLIALVGINAFWFGFNLVALNVPLYVTALLGQEEAAVATFMAVVFGVALLAFPVVNAATKRVGLRRMMLVSLVAFGLAYPLIFFLPSPPLGFDPQTYGLLVFALAGVGLAGFFIVPDAIIAAVADVDHSRSGQRREAMYFGVNGFVLKVNLGISTVVSAALLQRFGAPLGIQLTGPIGGAAVLLGAVVFLRYPEREVEAARARRDQGASS